MPVMIESLTGKNIDELHGKIGLSCRFFIRHRVVVILRQFDKMRSGLINLIHEFWTRRTPACRFELEYVPIHLDLIAIIQLLSMLLLRHAERAVGLGV